MAVSGRRMQGSSMSDSISQASDEDHDTSCQPCLFDGNNVAAEGFCQACGEYLCKTCLNVHRKQSATRSHVIIQKDQMPTGQSKVQDIYTEPCKIHEGGIVKFYCEVHEVVGCGDCMVLEHKSCKVELVVDVSVGYIGGQKQSEMSEFMKKFENTINERKKSLESADDKIAECHSKVIDDIKTFRKQINVYLDKMETDIVKEAMDIKKEQEKEMIEMKGALKSIENEIAEINRKRNSNATQSVAQFVIDHMAKEQLENLDTKLKLYQINNSDRDHEFQINEDINFLLQSNSPLGDIRTRKTTSCSEELMEMEATLIKTIEVEGSRITGSTNCPHGIIVLVDNLSNSVKILDTKDMTISASVSLPYRPWDVTRVKGNEIAVTVPDQKKIQFFVKRSDKLKETKATEVGGECYGITNMDNNLIVSYLKPCKIEMLNTDCRVLQTIVPVDIGKKLFVMPRFLDICPLTHNLYVSDYEKYTVTILTIDGHVLTTYTDTHSPQGLVALPDGAFLVASYGREHVQLVSADFRKKKLMVKQRARMKWPYSVCFSSHENKLFVSHDNGSKIDVYNIKKL